MMAKLQEYLNKVEEWADQNGFRFSLTKTKIRHFTTMPGMYNSPELKLGEQFLPYTDSIKFLWLIWNPKLTWKQHISTLRAECRRLLGVMRSVTGQEWGGDQHSTLKIYQTFIRAKLDYGAPIYNSATKTTLNALDAITTESLRIATGAFRTTPIDKLHVLANEMKLQHRRDYLALRYYYKIKSQISNLHPAHSHLVPLDYRTLFKNKGIPQPLNFREQDLLEKYKLCKQFIKPEFSYSLQGINTPTCTLDTPKVNLELNEHAKLLTPKEKYRQKFKRILVTSCSEHIKLYTEGSKRGEGVGAAVVWRTDARAASLPTEASVYTAEVHAISVAVRVAEEIEGTKFVVLSDSHSVLRTLMNIRSKHPVCRRLQH